jgi:hypothetical protein
MKPRPTSGTTINNATLHVVSMQTSRNKSNPIANIGVRGNHGNDD